MQDKDMVNDVLSMVNSSITNYANAIVQTCNQQVRQELQQIRNNCEAFQYELFKVAEQKGFYKPAQMADQNDINQVKNQLGS